MGRIVCGAVIAIGAIAAVAGCGTEKPVQVDGWSKASLSAAVLTEQDMPRGFLPAEDQKAFHGVQPRGPQCRRLLALADAADLREAPQVSAAFYQATPGATISQRVLHLTAARAHARIAAVRKAAKACPTMNLRVGDSTMRLERRVLPTPRLPCKDVFAVRYTQRASRNYYINFDVVVARVAEDLLVLSNPGIAHRTGGPTVPSVRKAVARLMRAQAGS